MSVSSWIVTIALVFALVPTASVRAEDTDRAELVRIQNALRTLRSFEQDSWHLYFLQANAMVAAYGG